MRVQGAPLLGRQAMDVGLDGIENLFPMRSRVVSFGGVPAIGPHARRDYAAK